MNASLFNANPLTHVKIVGMGLVGGIASIWIAMAAHGWSAQPSMGHRTDASQVVFPAESSRAFFGGVVR
jgi:hypothetical protein